MKVIRGLGIFLLGAIILGSCFDPPEFPIAPEIDFERIIFIDNPTGADSLVLYISFRDGDGDLGLDPKNPAHISAPYNNAYYFQENNGKLDTLSTQAGSGSLAQHDILLIPDPGKGKLVSFRTGKNEPAYNLPNFNCYNYDVLADRYDPPKPIPEGIRLLIEKINLPAIPTSAKIVDTLSIPPQQPTTQPTVYYQIKDTLYFRRNPNHYNIEVDFFIKDHSHPNADPVTGFYEYDWEKEVCQPFDGRFPVLSDKKNSLEGTLSYAMRSIGFQPLFGSKTLKLKVRIKDRALHTSRRIETPEFTLNGIKRK